MDPHDDRAATRLAWARAATKEAALTLAPASADASFRSYWRGHTSEGSVIVMDSPPDREDPRPWLEIGQRLAGAGLHVPAVIAADANAGLLLIEDLGNRTYLPELNADTVDALYGDALDALLRMQRYVDPTGLPAFDRAWQMMEMELMPTWFLTRHLGVALGCDGWDELELAFTVVLANIAAQPRGFMHRDFHSRNLLVCPGRNPGIIDFQGAMTGPVTYDLASLLRDCYIAWDDERVAGWVESHRLRLLHAHVIGDDIDTDTFMRWFDFAGLQRHIKVLGIFCRLMYRDGKASYLADLPLVLNYVMKVARRHHELEGFAAFLAAHTDGVDLTHPRP
jgi:aminoglycoside/choline kinase family phosphotransferase